MKISIQEYSLIINKHNQKLISIFENQKVYGGFLKTLIFWLHRFFDFPRCYLASGYVYKYIYIYNFFEDFDIYGKQEIGR